MRKILLITDQRVLAEGFHRILSGTPNELQPLEPAEHAELANTVESLRPGVVLLDWNREWTFGALSSFCSRLPHLHVILVVRDPTPELVYQAQEAGLSGLVDTRCESDEILSLLERTDSPEFSFDCPDGMALQRAKTVHMTPRECQLVRLLAQGLKNKEIATVLGISEGTVKVYLSKLFQKAGAKDRFEMALFGLKNMMGPADGWTEAATAPAARNGTKGTAGISTLVVTEPPAAAMNQESAGAHPQFSRNGQWSRRNSGPFGTAGFRPLFGRNGIAMRH